ncbi:MAG: hypothetical protein A2X49_00695 [Lentisphaerae bacterium GWF2_52_8]|nr:MAG: hypothetical protein A2X49_00695 [Lentisphaerae bacterium GWF2_52_8]
MLRAGFIGTGGIVSVHLDALKAMGNVEIAALCDTCKENAEKRQAQYGGKVYTDFNEMLKSERLDAVWLCTPPEVRELPLLACAEKGIPVFCEKPAERSETRAAALADKLEKLNARVQIGYVFRTNEVVQELKKQMAGDRIHLVQSLYACNMSLNMTSRSWFYDKDKSGGALIDQATHNLDLLRFLFGEVREVRGFASNPVKAKEKGYTIDEVISLSFAFENGTLGSHVHSWVGDGWRNEIVLSGEKAIYRLNPGGKLTVERKDCDPLKKDAKDQGDKVFEQKSNMYALENEVFLKMLKSGDWSANPSTYRDAAKTLSLTLACDRALQ